MRAQVTMPALGREVVIRELTVGEIRQWLTEGWLADIESMADAVDAALFGDFTLPDLLRLTDLTRNEIDGATPADLAAIWARAKAVNADFFQMRELRLEKMAAATDAGST